MSCRYYTSVIFPLECMLSVYFVSWVDWPLWNIVINNRPQRAVYVSHLCLWWKLGSRGCSRWCRCRVWPQCCRTCRRWGPRARTPEPCRCSGRSLSCPQPASHTSLRREQPPTQSPTSRCSPGTLSLCLDNRALPGHRTQQINADSDFS